MTLKLEGQFARADEKAKKTAAAIMRLVDRLFDQTAPLGDVAPDTVRHFLLLALIDRGFTEQLLDSFAVPTVRALRLSNALHDYRDDIRA